MTVGGMGFIPERLLMMMMMMMNSVMCFLQNILTHLSILSSVLPSAWYYYLLT